MSYRAAALAALFPDMGPRAIHVAFALNPDDADVCPDALCRQIVVGLASRSDPAMAIRDIDAGD